MAARTLSGARATATTDGGHDYRAGLSRSNFCGGFIAVLFTHGLSHKSTLCLSEEPFDRKIALARIVVESQNACAFFEFGNFFRHGGQ